MTESSHRTVILAFAGMTGERERFRNSLVL